MLKPLGHADSPHDAILREMNSRTDGAASRAFCFTTSLARYWLDDGSSVDLAVACEITNDGASRIALSDRADALAVARGDEGAEGITFAAFCDQFDAASANLAQPLLLGTHHEAKPWGEEIWYTGIEARGVCSAEGIPLPWLLSLGHPHLVNDPLRELILLKILAPHPVEVEGDLYFEMHREKVEVYVITEIDADAWPDGRGRIRMGFDPTTVARYEDRAAFEESYLECVGRYREVRREIDRQLDEFRAKSGVAPTDVVPTEIVRQWLEELPAELILEEQARRAEMDAFYALHELSVGDVVQILPGIPHSLQHGVRAVEFQTPHYERLILSFGQKVLTQDHWDTEEAVREMAIAPPSLPRLERLVGEPGVQVDVAARFDQFEVHRVTLGAGASYSPVLSPYGLAIGISGTTTLAGRDMGPEEAYLVPASLPEPEIANRTATDAIALIAFPR